MEAGQIGTTGQVAQSAVAMAWHRDFEYVILQVHLWMVNRVQARSCNMDLVYWPIVQVSCLPKQSSLHKPFGHHSTGQRRLMN